MNYIGKSAIKSTDGIFRYTLTRCWDLDKPELVYILLNPSIADADLDDATIRKCVGFADRLGYGCIAVVNLFAFRATDPKDLKTCSNPIGQGNNVVIKSRCSTADMIIAAWGTYGAHMNRAAEVLKLLSGIRRPIYCLGTTKDGYPKHPLYVPYETKPIIYKWEDNSNVG